jgi:tetratricopeptide (TPR) repeat protein
MPVRIFLSTVSDEFRDYRDQLRHDLTRHNVEVKVQEDFKDLGTVTLDKLDVYITNCDTVVHLVGHMTGASAKPESTRSMLTKYSDLPDKVPPLRQPLADGLAISYTQWEAWLALYHGKPLVIAKADDSAPRGPKYAPTDHSRAAQQEHLTRLSAVERYPGETFTSPDNLAKLVLSGAILDLLTIADNRRLRKRTAVAALASLLLLVSGYFAYDHWWRNENVATLIKQGEDTQALVRQLIANSQTPVAPGREQAVGAAVTNIATGAAAGDTRLQQALDLLKAGKVEEASGLLRAFAADKDARIREDSKQAAAAWRNLGAIAGLRDPKSAREAYARAVMLDPDDREALYWHGWLQLAAGDIGLADRDLNRLLQVSVAAHDDRGTYRAYLRLGEVFVARGNLQKAREYEDRAYDFAKLNAERNPNDKEWQSDLSVSYNEIGDVLKAQGDLPEALKSYRDGLAIRDRLAKADPGNASWQRDLSVSYGIIGDSVFYGIITTQRKLPEALKSYRDGLAIADRLAKADPGNLGLQRDVSLFYPRIGDVLVAQGNLPEATKSYRDGLAIADRLAKADPGNAKWQYGLGISNERIGDTLMAQGNLAEALRSYEAKQEIISRLAKSDPSNAGWQRDLSLSYSKLADAFGKAGDKTKALDALRQGRAIMVRLTSISPDNAVWELDLIRIDLQIAELDGTK